MPDVITDEDLDARIAAAKLAASDARGTNPVYDQAYATWCQVAEIRLLRVEMAAR